MAAADMDFGMPLFEKVEFFFDKWRAVGVAAAAIGAGGLIAYPVATNPCPAPEFPALLATGIALTGSVMLLTVGLTLLLRLFLHQGAALVIDAHGIHDRRTGAPMLPWTQIHDIRVLDRHGRLIGIETRSGISDALPRARLHWLPRALRLPYATATTTVIDTFFLQSRSGNRILDFVVPITAMTPIDLSETPVSEETLSADAQLSRRRMISVALFIVSAAIVPAAAAILATA
jgi:hypothetical protein